MSDYFEQAEYEPLEIPAPSSFVRPLNLDRRSATSHGSGLTYITDLSDHGAPPEPIFGMPTPIIPGQTSLLPGEYTEKDPSRTEFMMVEPDPAYRPDEESDVQVQGGTRGFVGGFVSGLRKLPRVMLRHPRAPSEPAEKKTSSHWRRGTESGTELPTYQLHSDGPPLDPANVEVVQEMDMPTPRTLSAASPSLRGSRDPDRTLYSDRHQSRPNTVTHHAGGSTLIHHSQINIGSPVQDEPQPGSDYDKMSSVLQVEPSVSIAQHITRIQKFFNDINDLPWVSSQVAVDYIPEKNGRRGTGKRKTPKASDTWYPIEANTIDLLSSGNSSSVPVGTHRREGGHRRAMTDSTMSPSSTGMSRRPFDSPSTNVSPRYSVTSEPTPGGRNIRHPRSPRHHQQRRPPLQQQNSPPQSALYPSYIATSQPMYIYSTPPTSSAFQQQPGSPGQGPGQQTSPAMPVYMIPMPPPVYQQMSNSYPYPVGKATSPPVRP